jgi:hypothetical protein
VRVMIFVKATKDSEAGVPPTREMADAMGKYNEELTKAGIMKDCDGLHPTSKAKRVAFDGAERAVIDGPFADTTDIVAGYWIWEVKDMAEAVEWVKRCPNPIPGPCDIEIRPIVSEAEFAEMLANAPKA